MNEIQSGESAEIGQPESFVAKILNTGTSKAVVIPAELFKVNDWDT